MKATERLGMNSVRGPCSSAPGVQRGAPGRERLGSLGILGRLGSWLPVLQRGLQRRHVEQHARSCTCALALVLAQLRLRMMILHCQLPASVTIP